MEEILGLEKNGRHKLVDLLLAANMLSPYKMACWIDPSGSVYEIKGEHDFWIRDNLDLLRGYGIEIGDEVERFGDYYKIKTQMYESGWNQLRVWGNRITVLGERFDGAKNFLKNYAMALPPEVLSEAPVYFDNPRIKGEGGWQFLADLV